MARANYRNLKKTNRFWVEPNRYRELQYACRQYKMWKSELAMLQPDVKSAGQGNKSGSGTGRPTEALAVRRAALSEKITAVEESALEAAGEELYKYIMHGVITGCEYDLLEIELGRMPPCGREKYYRVRRKFFWLLDKKY